MSEKQVFVPNGDNGGDKAVLLLAAAEEQGLDAGVVRVESGHASGMGYVVPKKVADAALSGSDAEGVEDFADPWDVPEPPQATDMTPQHEAEADLQDERTPAKKTAKRPARKRAAKKTAAKKTTAKKTGK